MVVMHMAGYDDVDRFQAVARLQFRDAAFEKADAIDGSRRIPQANGQIWPTFEYKIGTT